MYRLDVPLQKLLVVEGLAASLALPRSEVVVADLMLSEFILVLVAVEESIRNQFCLKTETYNLLQMWH